MPYKSRLELLTEISNINDCKQLYRKLEHTTTTMSELNHPVYKIIAFKEKKYGNASNSWFNSKQHSSEYHSLRLEIARGLDSYKIRHNKELEWCGVCYNEVMRLERLD